MVWRVEWSVQKEDQHVQTPEADEAGAVEELRDEVPVAAGGRKWTREML